MALNMRCSIVRFVEEKRRRDTLRSSVNSERNRRTQPIKDRESSWYESDMGDFDSEPSLQAWLFCVWVLRIELFSAKKFLDAFVYRQQLVEYSFASFRKILTGCTKNFQVHVFYILNTHYSLYDLWGFFLC